MALGGNNYKTPKLHSLDVTQSIQGIGIPIIYGTNRVQANLLWYGDFYGTKAPVGGSGLGKSGGYNYYADVLAVLCQGPILGLGSIWSSNGRLNLQTAGESYTIPTGGGTYTPVNASIIGSDNGVTVATAYSYSVNDFGSGAGQTLAGTMHSIMVSVGFPPSAGQYQFNSATGGYTFSAADAGKTVTVNYSYSLYVLGETEDYNVPSAGPYEISVKEQTYFRADGGVQYVSTGNALTEVNVTPTVTGTYQQDGAGNYYFASGDAGAAVAISYTWKQQQSTIGPSASLQITLINGLQGQSPWSLLASKHASQALGYSTLAMVAGQNMYLGQSGSLPNYNYEVKGQFFVGGGIVDADVASVIADLLTNSLYGAGYTGSFDASLTGVARNYWNASSYFISPVINKQTPAANLVDEWCHRGNVGNFFSEGKMKFIPYGDTSIVGNGFFYQAPAAAAASLTDSDFLMQSGDDPVQVERAPREDAYNSVWVEFNNRVNNYNPDIVQEMNGYAMAQFGPRQMPTISAEYICRQDTAAFVANCAMNRMLYIRTKYKFTLSAIRYGYLEPMDLLELTDSVANLVAVPARITEINEDGDGKLAIVCEEYPYGSLTGLIHPKQTTTQPNPQFGLTDPGDTIPVIFETTMKESNQVFNSFRIAAASTNPAWGGCSVWVSSDGTNYNKQAEITDFSRIGVTTAALPLVTDPDTTSTLSVNLAQSEGTLTSISASAWNNFDTLCALIGANNQIELVAFETATLTGSFKYNLTNLHRGVYGSNIYAWPSGTTFVRLDESILKTQYPGISIGQTLYFKFTSFNVQGPGSKEQSLADVAAYTWTPPGATLAPVGPGVFAIPGASPLSTYTTTLSNAAIVVAPFVAQVNQVEVNCLSAPYTISGLLAGQTYDIYYVDKTFTGGNIIPIATQNTGDFTGKTGYYLIGSITTTYAVTPANVTTFLVSNGTVPGQGPNPAATWTDVAGTISGYEIRMSAAYTPWAQAQVVATGISPTASSYAFTSNLTGYYQICAYNQYTLPQPGGGTTTVNVYSVTPAASVYAYASTAPAGNITNVNILNPGFELGNVDWALGAGWSIVANASAAHSGNWVAEFNGSAATAIASASWNISTFSSFDLAAWINPNGSPGTAYVRMNFYSGINGTGTLLETQTGSPISGGTGWQQSQLNGAQDSTMTYTTVQQPNSVHGTGFQTITGVTEARSVTVDIYITGNNGSVWYVDDVAATASSPVLKAATTTGSVKNLVPDSDVKFASTYWSPVGLTVGTGVAANGANGFQFTGTGISADHASSTVITVVPGTAYALSGYIDASHVASGTPSWAIYDTTGATLYASAAQPAGASSRVFALWTCPAGVTQVKVDALTGTAVTSSGGLIAWSAPQLQTGSAVTAYVSNVADDSTGSLLHGTMSSQVRSTIASSASGTGAQNINYAAGSSVDSLMPAQPGADVTGTNTSLNTANLGNVSTTRAQTLVTGANNTAANLIANPNFEDQFTGWTLSTSGSQAIDTSTFYAGTQSCSTVYTGVGQYVSLIAGHTYIGQCWVKTAGSVVAGGSIGAAFNIQEPSGYTTMLAVSGGTAVNVAGVNNAVVLEASSATGWTLIQITFRVNTSTVFFIGLVPNYGSGAQNAEVWYDGVSLVDVTSASTLSAISDGVGRYAAVEAGADNTLNHILVAGLFFPASTISVSAGSSANLATWTVTSKGASDVFMISATVALTAASPGEGQIQCIVDGGSAVGYGNWGGGLAIYYLGSITGLAAGTHTLTLRFTASTGSTNFYSNVSYGIVQQISS